MEGQRSASSASAAGVVVAVPRRAGFEPWLTKKQLAAHYGYSVRWLNFACGMACPRIDVGGSFGFCSRKLRRGSKGGRRDRQAGESVRSQRL